MVLVGVRPAPFSANVLRGHPPARRRGPPPQPPPARRPPALALVPHAACYSCYGRGEAHPPSSVRGGGRSSARILAAPPRASRAGGRGRARQPALRAWW